jgi:hypothetical protein
MKQAAFARFAWIFQPCLRSHDAVILFGNQLSILLPNLKSSHDIILPVFTSSIVGYVFCDT